MEIVKWSMSEVDLHISKSSSWSFFVLKTMLIVPISLICYQISVNQFCWLSFLEVYLISR